MIAHKKPGRINIKAVVILLSIVAVLGVGAVVGRKVRSRIIADNALVAAKTALEAEDWSEAAKQLNTYLNRQPEDIEMLEEYARVNLRIRPREPSHLATAAATYRMLLRHKPDDAQVNHRLADLYRRIGNFVEAEHICRNRLEAFPADTDARMSRALALLALKRSEDAAVELVKLVEAEPDRVRAFSLLASLSIADGGAPGRAAAADWLDKSVEANPNSATAWVHRARFRRMELRDPDGASSDIEQAEGAASPSAEEYLAIATEWVELQALDRAAAAIRAADDAPVGDEDAEEIDLPNLGLARFFVSAKLALMQRDGPAGVALARGALDALDPALRPRYLPAAIDLFLRGGEANEAREALETFRSLVSARAATNRPLRSLLEMADAAVASAEGTPYRVIELLERLAGERTKNAGVWRLLWQAFEQTGQPRRALRAAEAYLELEPNDVQALRAAASLERGHDATRAAAYASRAAKANPQSAEARLLAIRARIRSFNKASGPTARQKIDAEINAILSLEPANLSAHALRVGFLFQTDRPNEAEAAVRQAESSSDNVENATMLRLEFMARSGELEEAERVCAEAITANPAFFELRMTLAQLQFGRGAFAEARTTLALAAEESEGAPQLRAEYAMAELLHRSGDADGAIAQLRKIADRHPDEVPARRLLLTQEKVFNDEAQARALVDELRQIEGDQGLRWQLEDARLRLRQDGFRSEADQIETSLKNCLRGDPGWPEATVVLGFLYEQLGRPLEAQETYERAYDNSSGAASIEIVAPLLDLLVKRSAFAQASTILSRLPVDDARLRGYRIGVAMGQRDSTTAIDELDRRLQENPTDAKAMVVLAQIVYSQSQDAQRALKLLDTAAAEAPELDAIAPTRAYILHSEDRDDEALTMINAEVVRRGDYGSFLLRAGFKELIGLLENAEADFQHLATIPDSQGDGYTALGDFLIRQSRTDDAVAAWREALKHKPGDTMIEVRVLTFLVGDANSEKREQAHTRLDELLVQHPDDARLLFLRAGLDLTDNTREAVERAIQRLERAVASDPGFAPAHAQLIRLATLSGARERAAEYVRRASRDNVRAPAVMLARAEFEIMSGNPLAARSFAASVLKADPKNSAARIVLARIALGNDDMNSALDHIDSAILADPANAQAVVIKAELLRIAEETDEAISLLGEFLAAQQGSPPLPVLLSVASMQIATGDFASADVHLLAAEALAPDDVRVIISRLDWLGAQQRFAEIAAIGAREAASQTGRVDVILRAASALSIAPEKAFNDQALAMLQKALESSPHPAIMVAVGQLSYQKGLVKQAHDTYLRLLEIDPYNVPALNDLSWIMATDMNDPAGALIHANKGIDRDPNFVHLLDTRGVIHGMLDRFEESQADLEACVDKAENLPGTRARALLHLAETHIKQGNLVAARQRLDEANRIDETDQVFSDVDRAEADRLREQAGR